jgi:hypothetical protein
MRTMRDVAALLALPLTTDQLRAGRYLEARGLRFCVEFGHENAIAVARADWLQRRRALYRERVGPPRRRR